jgi:hypothetical protein
MHRFRRNSGIAVVALALAMGTACASTVTGTQSYGQAKCEGETVKPSGSPYCFVVPTGFQKVTQVRLGRSKWASGVGLDDNNLILTGVLPSNDDASTLSGSEILRRTDAYVHNLSGLQLKEDKGVLVTLPSGRAVEYRGTGQTDTGDSVNLHFFFIYNDKNVLQLNCQSTSKTEQVEKGCTDVLPTIHLS